jgi:hypothetical protein
MHVVVECYSILAEFYPSYASAIYLSEREIGLGNENKLVCGGHKE